MTGPQVSRRALILGGGALALVPGLAACGEQTGSTGTVLKSSAPLPQPYTVPFTRPPAARSTQHGAPAYELVARPADVEILPGRKTRILGYDGTFPGPTITARAGQQTTVRLRNDLPVPTVMHLHGGVTPSTEDGYPTDLVQPRNPAARRQLHGGLAARTVIGERTYTYPLRQRAAPLWYHDHTMDFTGPNVYAGLAGMFLVHDDEDDALPLPRGERDVPLIICDRAFGPDGELSYPALSANQKAHGVRDSYLGGVLGDVVLVNGRPWPLMQVDQARYRFRVLNASNARRFSISMDHGVDLVQVGTDQGLLPAPQRERSLTLAPAERVDVVVDFSTVPVGTRVTMRNGFGSGGAGQVMQFQIARKAKDDSRIPARLSTVEPLRETASMVTRDLHFALGKATDGHPHGEWSVNGITFADGKDIARPRLGTVERWRISSDVHHPVHPHMVRMQLYGKPELGWKDTIDVVPGDAVEVLVQVEGYRGRYVMHCHNLEHEDMAMMVHFTVT
ncbi:multicopper oxidase family protein [Luteipulveratus mongoliensis]|uniref:Multicopper oxidase CueO n=1 Tax=Luteipulveratus mongoliensis TaxID=571913 RepID=A0A0K1JIG2_9MICO|nr:multicopper oxidase family protein [Luteipulveratus mongoliensis]AKU16368.1 hypothetical protein VV02_11665 [Luteipulveratus mongoliensis]